MSVALSRRRGNPKGELGGDLAFDVDRSYRLERAGYHVRWSHLPDVITPQNRVIVARPRVQAGSP